jgi:hypothetical protein
MPFTKGDLCCPQDMCVALDTEDAASTSVWGVIPHVTQMQWSQTANVARIVTSSTGGNETSVCGPINTTGTLQIACHSGLAPRPLAVNGKYVMIWGLNCDDVEDYIGDTPGLNVYHAKVRITAVNNDLNPSAGGAVIYNYTWEIVEWIYHPATQDEKLDN